MRTDNDLRWQLGTCDGRKLRNTLAHLAVQLTRLTAANAALLVSVRDCTGGRIPPWGNYLTDCEILDTLAYARTFCKGREHDSLQNLAQR